MISYIIIIPLLLFINIGLIGRKIGIKGTPVLSIIIPLIILIKYILDNRDFTNQKIIELTLGDWINTSTIKINWQFSLDTVSILMVFVVYLISLLVSLFTVEYMRNDPHQIRFFSYLSLFVFFMIILLTASNIIVLLVGWEGVGLSSFLLICFWFSRIEAIKSAIKAMIINRIADIFLLMGVIITWYWYKSYDFYNIISLVNKKEIILLVLLGTFTKSAQIIWHTWLPSAMEGPTPVSALIHAATMVTAGIYLMIRLSPILERNQEVVKTLIILGGLTSLFAALVGMVQNDVKRIIAYSTCSQLGYMVLAIGTSNYYLALFHLINHAFFKAQLFLGVGYLIHSDFNNQDIRKYGNYIKYLPFAYTMILIPSLSLTGIPYLSGYYSKERIIQGSWVDWSVEGVIGYWLGNICIIFTAIYNVRIIYLVFINKNNSLHKEIKIKENNYLLSIPLLLLSFCSIGLGFITKELYLSHIEAERSISRITKELPVIMTILGIIMGLILVTRRGRHIRWIHELLINKFYFDIIYNNIVKIIIKSSYQLNNKVIDMGILETLGVQHLISNIVNKSLIISRNQSGYLHHYLIIVISSLLYILIMGF